MSDRNTGIESALVRLLVILFGMGSWITISGIWVEVPILVGQGIPEQYRLNAYLTVAINLAFVGPVLFVIISHFASTYVRHPEIPTNYVITFIGMVGTFLLIFYWDSYTVWSVDGSMHSTALLTLTVLIALVDLTSNASFLGFMSLLKSQFINWYWIGQGFSGLLPAIASLIQTAGSTDGSCERNLTFLNETVVIGNETLIKNCTAWRDTTGNWPVLFGPSEYFAFLFVLMLTCHLSFIALNTLPCSKREYVSDHERYGTCCGSGDPPGDEEELGNRLLILGSEDGEVYDTPQFGEAISTGDPSLLPVSDSSTLKRDLSKTQFAFLYIILFLDMGLMYGIFSAIQSFSAGAYGHDTYEIIFPLRETVKVVSFSIFLWKPVYSFSVVLVTFVLGTVAGIYCLAVAIMSPYPPFGGLLIGKILIGCAWGFEGFFMLYCKAALTWIIRNGPNSRKHLIWTGVLGQVGVLLGTVIIFPLVHDSRFFEEYSDSCRKDVTCEWVTA